MTVADENSRRKWRVSVVDHAHSRWAATFDVEADDPEQARMEALRRADNGEGAWTDVDGHTEHEFGAYDVEPIDNQDDQ